jgi:DNA (cytosine-5)-methyltransferase 3A
MNVLSLFDGMSCGQQALERAGVKVNKYFASEIDKYAIQVTMANYPETIQLGSVVNVIGKELPKIDLLIGGSPCQSFSFAGKRKGMSTKDEQEILTLNHYLELKSQEYEFEGQSYLFWEYMRLLNEVKPKYFLLENVMMSQKWKDVLTNAIGINPIMINSALVSAQNRKRLYWTNIGAINDGLFGEITCGIQQPDDCGVLLKDILEPQVDSKYYVSIETNKRLKKLTGAHEDLDEGTMLDCYNQSIHKEKSITLSTRVDASNHTHVVHTHKQLVREVIQLNQSKESNNGTQPYQQNRVYDTNGLSPALCKDKSDLMIKSSHIRKLTPVECERLQTVKDNYTAHVSNAQRYKMLGNGWTVDVIAHIFAYINK